MYGINHVAGEERTIGGVHSYLIELLREVVPNLDGITVLDVGCGSGVWLRRLGGIGLQQLHGLDWEIPQDTTGFRFTQFDLNKDSLTGGAQYDVISCIEVIEHVENPGNLMDLFGARLKHDGVLLLTSPNIESLRARLRAVFSGAVPNFDAKGDATHIFPLLSESLDKLCRPRGLRVERALQYPPDPTLSLMFRPGIVRLARFLGRVLPDARYADISVYVIRRI